ncbi:MAG: 2-oxoacid:acceptor oxidoreductase family protein [Spirochaetes bacterium]|nr:2-oxoacid:acceptor oxidoreductase family protein [Spirochaetota bacterium]
MTERIIIAGFGGQGVLFSGKLLAQAGMMAGFNVTEIPSYGAEMRGGTANAAIIISDKEIASPIIETPTTFLCLNAPSLERFIDSLAPGGLLVLNTSLVKNKPPKDDITIIGVNANDLAAEAGNPGVVNMPVIGAYLKARGVLTLAIVERALDKVISEKHKDLLAINKKALTAGFGA